MDNSYSHVSDISLTSLQENMDRLQSNNKEHMNEEYALNLEEDEETLHLEEDEEAEDTLHLEEEDEEDMMIQDDYEEQS